jgi:EAL and modified HD-GYP domain-containing signal transduction protein
MTIAAHRSSPARVLPTLSRMRHAFVARQPIFDLAGSVTGYELLYRHSAEVTWAAGVGAEKMCADTVLRSVLDIGLARLTAGRRAWVNVTREFLVAGHCRLLSPNDVVIELLETIVGDEEVLAIVKGLKADGYTFALDDFEVDERGAEGEGLLPYATFVKVDVLNRDAESVRRQADRLAPYGVTLLAERVETEAVRDVCAAAGYQLFQGYFFCKPETVTARDLDVAQASVVRLMSLLEDAKSSVAEIENAFRGDPALTFKLLRIVNSAALGGRGIESIGFALRMVGRQTLHRWLALIFVSGAAGNGDGDAELVLTALMRARLCELAAERTGRGSLGGALFMTGLFAQLDALLKAPMPEIVRQLNVGGTVRDALLRQGGPCAAPLQMAEAYERGAWDDATSLAGPLGLAPDTLAELWEESLGWARERMLAVAA